MVTQNTEFSLKKKNQQKKKTPKKNREKENQKRASYNNKKTPNPMFRSSLYFHDSERMVPRRSITTSKTAYGIPTQNRRKNLHLLPFAFLLSPFQKKKKKTKPKQNPKKSLHMLLKKGLFAFFFKMQALGSQNSSKLLCCTASFLHVIEVKPMIYSIPQN